MPHLFTVALYFTGQLEDRETHVSDRLYVAIGVKVPDSIPFNKEQKYQASKAAVDLAKAEAAKAYGRRTRPEAFQVLCVFEGKQDPVFFGFQPGFDR